MNNNRKSENILYSSSISGLITAFITNPIEVIKVRLQIQRDCNQYFFKKQ